MFPIYPHRMPSSRSRWETPTMVLSSTLIRHLILSAATLVTLGLVFARDARGSDDSVLQAFKFDRSTIFVTLPVTLGGKEHLFLVDTGSSHTVYSTALRGELGKSLGTAQAVTATGPMSFSVFEAPAAMVGNLPLHTRSEMVACFDLKSQGMGLNRPLAGVIGMKFLHKHRLEIDFDNGTISFLRRVSPVQSRHFRRTPIKFNDVLIPRVEAELSGVSTMMKIDTGYEGTGHIGDVLGRQLYNARKLNVAGMEILSGAAGREAIHLFRCDRVNVADFAHSGLIFSARIRDEPPKSNRSKFGVGYLNRFHLIFDFPDNQLYLRPSRIHELKDKSDSGGMLLQGVDGHATVTHVLEGTTASGLGIKPGDRLLRVDSRSTSTYSGRSVAGWIRRREDSVRLQFVRAGNVYTVTLP